MSFSHKRSSRLVARAGCRSFAPPISSRTLTECRSTESPTIDSTADLDWHDLDDGTGVPRLSPRARGLAIAWSVFLAVVLVGVPSSVWYHARYDAWPGESVPTKLHWCGRAYGRAGEALPASAVLPPIIGDGPREFETLSSYRLPLGLPHDIVVQKPLDPRWSCAGQRASKSTMTYVFVRSGSRYIEYDLVGGP